MKTYLIGYDLIKQGQDYETLYEQIEQFGTIWHCIDSTWIIKSNSSAIEIANHLEQYVDDNDKLIVLGLTNEAAWTGFDEECSQWLLNNLK